ncbi:MAG: TetR/AcrR family transcriptional regulator [Monoglobales bacterium]
MARNKYPEQTVKSILDAAQELFIEHGYEHTSLQDIINKTKLSKGAIYHHFASKEEIFVAMVKRIGEDNSEILAKVRDDKSLNGYEKLKTIFKAAIFNTNQDILLTAAPNLLENPRLLAMQFRDIFDVVVPDFILPILQEAIDDGSIQTDYPKELAEAMMILANLWLNPLVHETEESDIERKCIAMNKMLIGLGVDLIDDEMIARYKQYCKQIKK